MIFSELEKKVITQLQRGVAPVARPFQGLELPEDQVLVLLQRVADQGLMRRFGGVFDARRLGYRSVLCALDISPELMEEKAALICSLAGVTHCYERRPRYGTKTYPALWFTLALLKEEFDAGLDSLQAQLSPGTLLTLPSIHRFKIDVVFDLHSRKEAAPASLPRAVPVDDDSSRPFSAEEQALVRAIDQQLPLVAQPFAAVANDLGMTEERVLSLLKCWKEQGALRRIGAILYHREAGFKANAMCVWPVDGDVAEAGRQVAARSEVTHCYQRPCFDAFPFDLYAMIHTGSWDDTETLFAEISSRCGLKNGQLFTSGREFKKSSMRYFR